MKRVWYYLSLAVLIFFVFLYLFFPKSCSKNDSSICSIEIKGTKLNLEVAYGDKKQIQGLMFVTKLKNDFGMIFVYDEIKYLSFWMKNTLIPLSIAYVEADGRISGIYNMYPIDKNTPDDKIPVYSSRTKVKYAIETNQGWFELRGIKEGTYIDIPRSLE